MKKEEQTIEFVKDQMEFSRRLYRMPLLTEETFKIGLSKTHVKRVPGGWIFGYNDYPCFVPYDNEFHNGDRTDINNSIRIDIQNGII